MPDVDYNEIEDIVDSLYEKSIIKFEEKQEARKVIHVSDLTGDCLRKAWYRINGYTPDKKDFKKALPLVHGTMLHECCDLNGVEHEKTMFANIFEMRPVIPCEIITDKNKLYKCVKGSMDDLIEIDEELIICDKKTTKKSIPKEVSEQYKLQMNIYKLLYFIETGIDINRAAIIYIDKSSAWERHKTRCFDLLPIEEIRSFVQNKLELLSKDEAPPKVVTFLCPWCPFYTECNPN